MKINLSIRFIFFVLCRKWLVERVLFVTVFLFIIATITVILILIILSKLTASIHYYHGNDNDQLLIHIKALYGLIHKKIEVPVIKVDKQDTSVQFKVDETNGTPSSNEKGKITLDSVMESMENVQQFVHSVRNVQPILKRFFKRLIVHEFVWKSLIGTSDAALTARLTGAIWTGKGFVQMFLYKYVSVRCVPVLEVTPFYHQKRSVTDLRCIVSISVGNAIITALKLIVQYKRSGGHFPIISASKKQSVEKDV